MKCLYSKLGKLYQKETNSFKKCVLWYLMDRLPISVNTLMESVIVDAKECILFDKELFYIFETMENDIYKLLNISINDAPVQKLIMGNIKPLYIELFNKAYSEAINQIKKEI